MAGTESEARQSTFIPQEESLAALEKLEDRCGIVGIRTKDPTYHFETLLNGGYGVQHRGLEGANVRLVGENGRHVMEGGQGLIPEVFTEDFIEQKRLKWVRGKLSGYHGRYATHGRWGEGNKQPIIRRHYETETDMAVFHNGQFVNIEKMRSDVGEGIDEGASDTHLFAEMLARAQGANWDERVLSTLDKVDGAYNLIIHVGDTMYVARDKFGLHPLVLGKINFPDTDGVIVASETSAFTETGAEYERFVRREEVFRVDDEGFTQLREGVIETREDEETREQICSMEVAYFQRPDALGPNEEAIALSRKRLGEIMGKRIQIPNADFVLGLPESGTMFALGFAKTSGIPFENYIIKNRYPPKGSRRAFQEDHDKSKIRSIVAGKMRIILGPHWKGAKVVLGDDSAVRGDGSSEVASILYDLGVSEIYLVLGYLPIKFPCHLGISIRSPDELVANKGDVAKAIGIERVEYPTPEEFILAYRGDNIILPSDPSEIMLENGMCGGCATGKHPISKEGVIWQSPRRAKEPVFVHQ